MNPSRHCVAKTTDPLPVPFLEPPNALHNHFSTLDLPTRRHLTTFTSQGSTLKEWCTGASPASFDDSLTPLHDVKSHSALHRAEFLKEPKYVISKIMDGPKQSSARLKYFVRRYEYESKANA